MGAVKKPPSTSKLGNMARTSLLILLGACLAMSNPEPAVVGSVDSKVTAVMSDDE